MATAGDMTHTGSSTAIAGVKDFFNKNLVKILAFSLFLLLALFLLYPIVAVLLKSLK